MSLQSRTWRARPRNMSPSGIHDDERARELGFEGGFVPGVMLYEHVVAELVNQGVGWLTDGRAEMRFRRPVYDNEEVSFEVEASGQSFTIRGDDDMGPRSTGLLTIDRDAPELPVGEPVSQIEGELGQESQLGVLMRIEQTIDPALFDRMAASSGFPRGEGRKLMPVAQYVNPISMIYEYFGHSTTIHFESRVWHHSPLHEDETFSTTGAITGFSERRGNQIVHFTALIAAADGRPVATIEHSSVYRLARQRERQAGD